VLLDGLLRNLSKKLGFPTDGTTRISLYVHDESNRFFVPGGRYSSNPYFDRKGRTQFSDEEGCISKGWRHDWHFDAAVPDDTDEAAKYHLENYGVADSTYRSLKMKPKLFAAKKIVDSDDRPVAVLVVESEKRDAFEESDLVRNMGEAAQDLASTICAVKDHIPLPNLAAEAGL
jgi:hypothetical protein